MDMVVILALALVALAAALLAWAWRRNRPPCASVRTLGYFCRGCWIKFLEGNGISEP